MAPGVAGAKLLVLLKASDHSPYSLSIQAIIDLGRGIVKWGKSVL